MSRGLIGDVIGVEIEAAEMELDGDGEPLFVEETTAKEFDCFDSVVEAFGGGLEDDNVDDSPEGLLDHFGNSF